jgi:two-component system, NarL family, sensor histidine kinase UhpB
MRRNGAYRKDTAEGRRPIAARLFRLPLFYKLVIANGAITLAAILICASVVARLHDPSTGVAGVVLPVGLIAFAVVVAVNALVVRLALSPLRALEDAAEEIRAGHDSARVVESPLSDASTARLIGTFNAMLDSVETYRRRLREIANRALDAGENERLRLSHELHDEVAQSLTALLVQLRVARANGQSGDQLAAVAEQLSAIIEEVRALASRLRPPALDMLGLGAAVSAHARNVSATSGVRVTTVIDNVDGALPKEAELAMYRLVQEALLNVVRHSDSDEVKLEIRRRNGQVEATVKDQGRGFELDSAISNGALGLIGMYERAGYVGGKVNIDSAPGQGTTVRIEIPIEEKAQPNA